MNADSLAAIKRAQDCGKPGCGCGRSAQTHCPSHSDQHPSLSIKLAEGKLLFHCHAGCTQTAVIKSFRDRGLWLAHAEDGRPNTYRGQTFECWYDYFLASGALAFSVGRTSKKDFPVFHLDSAGKWSTGYGGPRILYGLPELGAESNDRPVLLVEGEKDVDRARACGYLATCTPGGAAHADKCDLEPLRGRSLILIPDHDPAGQGYARDLIRILSPIAALIKRVDLPGLPLKGDLSDWLDWGHSAADLDALIADAPAAALDKIPSPLRFRTAAELTASTPEQPPFVVRGILYEGAITEEDGKVKSGKSTFTGFLVRSVLDGGLFLGLETRRTSVVWLTEEREPSTRAMLARCGLLNAANLHLLSLFDTGSIPWPDVAVAALSRASKCGSKLVIVDTLSRFARIPGDEENNPGAAAEAIAPLEMLAAHGLAVLAIRHDRKSGGEIGDSARGSSAFSGAADIILNLRRANTEGHETRRLLLGIGRFDDVPDRLTIELRDGRYELLGDAVEVEKREARARLLDKLPTSIDKALTEEEILEQMPTIARSTFQRARDELLAEGLIQRRKGYGKYGRAYGHFIAETAPYGPPFIENDAGQKLTPHVSDIDVSLHMPSQSTLGTIRDNGLPSPSLLAGHFNGDNDVETSQNGPGLRAKGGTSPSELDGTTIAAPEMPRGTT